MAQLSPPEGNAGLEAIRGSTHQPETSMVPSEVVRRLSRSLGCDPSRCSRPVVQLVCQPDQRAEVVASQPGVRGHSQYWKSRLEYIVPHAWRTAEPGNGEVADGTARSRKKAAVHNVWG